MSRIPWTPQLLKSHCIFDYCASPLAMSALSNRSRTVLTIFLASPGDLPKERDGARRVIDELNQTLTPPLRLMLELLLCTGEDLGAGHPRHTLIPRVDECDIFVGLLWRKWANPGVNPTSEFWAAFERARQRRRETDQPEIWLAFKAIDEAHETDPGPQLQALLAFRREQTTAGEVLIRQFDESADFEGLLRQLLMAHIMQHYFVRQVDTNERAQGLRSALGPTTQPRETSTAIERVSNIDRLAVPEDLTDASRRLNAALSHRESDDYFGAAFRLPEVTFLRVLVHCKAWLSLCRRLEALSVHELNLLYQHRLQVTLVAPEQSYLLRLLASDEIGVYCGWYWLRGETVDNATNMLAHGARLGNELEALNLLAEAQIPLRHDTLDRLIETATAEESGALTGAILSYLTAVGSAQHLRLLPTLSRRPDFAAQARLAEMSILARCNPGMALRIAAEREPQDIPDSVVQLISPDSLFVDLALAERLSKHQDKRIRVKAVRALIERKAIDVPALRTFTSDRSYRVREIAYNALIDFDAEVSVDAIRASFEHSQDSNSADDSPLDVDTQALILRIFQKTPVETLQRYEDWVLVDGPHMYQALCLAKFAENAEQLRRNLEDNFVSFLDRALKQLQFALEPMLSRFVRFLYVEAALAVLAQHGSTSDITYARNYLQSESPTRSGSALRILERFAETSDADLLFTIASSTYGENRLRIAAILAKLGSSVVHRMLQTGDPGMVGAALCQVEREYTSFEAICELVEPLLSSEHPMIRILSTALLVRNASAAELEALMDRYRGQGRYYYNVGSWLDRVLYAPAPFKDFFRTKLDSELKKFGCSPMSAISIATTQSQRPELSEKECADLLRNAMWVLECEEQCQQGTAFALRGYGLVTCHHVLCDHVHQGLVMAFRPEPHLVGKKYPVSLVASHEVIDLAVLLIDAQLDNDLEMVHGVDGLNDREKIYVGGFPGFSPGFNGNIMSGQVVGHRPKSGVRRAHVSAFIVEGASGGPVVNQSGVVVGVAVTGARSMEEAPDTEKHGVIPIGAIKELRSKWK